jgi:ABC-2 type transport system permease protein
MSAVLALSFLFSALVENAIGPIVASMAVIIIFLILSAIPISALEVIKPYLFTNYMDVWRDFFDDPVATSEIIKSILILLMHTIGLYAIALFIFIRKDILS